MTRTSVEDALAALSLANLSLIGKWDGLLNYTPSQAFHLEHAPLRAEYAAAFVTVILIGLVFLLLIRLARWIAARYGTAGFALGSLPILFLIALPAAKSIFHLLVNRYDNLDSWTAVAIVAAPVAVAAIVARRRFLTFASAALVAISPLILLEGALSISRCRTDRSSDYADGPLAPRAPQTSRPRVVWIIFDELDYRLAFPDRSANVPMQSFDRLRAESLFAENAFAPGPDTIPSVPELLIGKYLSTIEQLGPAKFLLDGTPASDQATIFSSVHKMGANAAVVGWYFPYCRLFSRDLASCSAQYIENELNETSSGFLDSVILLQQSLFSYGNRSLLGESPQAKHRIGMLNAMHRDALRALQDPTLNLVFLHLPLPHAPYLYDRFSYTFPKRYLGFGSYLDNLALADIFLGDFRDALTNAGLWDKTTVLVSSDHPDRMSRSVDGKDDPRVPFLLKMAGQTSGATYEPPLLTVVTKSLIEAILNRQITTSEEAVKWLTAHPK